MALTKQELEAKLEELAEQNAKLMEQQANNHHEDDSSKSSATSSSFSFANVVSQINANIRKNSGFDAESHYVEGKLLDFKADLGKRTKSNDDETPTSLAVVRGDDGHIYTGWVDSDKVVNVTPDNITARVMLEGITFKSTAGYDKGGIKAGGVTFMFMSLKLIGKPELSEQEKADIKAKAYAKAGVTVIA